MLKRSMCVFTTAIILVGLGLMTSKVYAAETTKVLTGVYNEYEVDSDYDFSKNSLATGNVSRFKVTGNIDTVGTKDGCISYSVSEGNLKILIDSSFKANLYDNENEAKWHIIDDKSKKVDSTELNSKVKSGATIVQTSKDGKAWVNAFIATDIYKDLSSLNNSDTDNKAMYTTTNVQLVNGCYYRIIVAYKMERSVEPKKVAFISIPKKEQKEVTEVYQFYAYDKNVNRKELIDTSDAYEFGDVFRVDSQDGFKNPTKIDSDDPHNDWTIGKFYVSGYTSVLNEDGEIPVFLKTPGDKAALWFNLEQDINKCNGKNDIRVEYIDSGSDIEFGTPTINDFGRGALIVRKTDDKNKKERQIYTNYLEASATVGANTRVDLFEEGDYEVALDYQLHYDKPFVFKTKTTKTLTYRIAFKFKVRNGDISMFVRDATSDKFLNSGDIATSGFYIDVANSKYLKIAVKRELLNEGLTGLVVDTKFDAVGKEGRKYTDEGIYNITVTNNATGREVEKRVYVGDSDILKAHMKTGLTISAINERIALGATIDEEGNIIDPIPEVPEEPQVEEISEEPQVEEASENAQQDTSPEVIEVVKEKKDNQDDLKQMDSSKNTEIQTEDTATTDEDSSGSKGIAGIVIFSIVFVCVVGLTIPYMKKRQNVEKGQSER